VAETGSAMGKRVLFVAYAFPPVGGAGVQRITKFVKYLHQYGWTPSVLTASNPSVPLWDPTLVADIPQHAVVRRARTLEPGYGMKAAVFSDRPTNPRPGRGVAGLAKALVYRLARMVLQPDPQILWMPGAVREGRRLLDELPHAAIVASGPPFSSFLVGARLARHSGVPLVLDYRDEWDIANAHSENRRFGSLSLCLQQRMQLKVVRAARVLLATTQCSMRALEKLIGIAGCCTQAAFVYNGFDPEDFPSMVPPSKEQEDNRRYRLVYVGTLWNLTSVAPVVEAVKQLEQLNPDLAGRLQIEFAGRRTPEQQQLVELLRNSACCVVEHPYLDHHGAIKLMRSADGLCLLLSDLPGMERVVPAKMFEYMAAAKPILAIGPRGEMWELLNQHPAAFLHTPDDTVGIAENLAQEIRRVQAGRSVDLTHWDASRFDRRNQAGQLAAILDSLVAEGSSCRIGRENVELGLHETGVPGAPGADGFRGNPGRNDGAWHAVPHAAGEYQAPGDGGAGDQCAGGA
jgi:hypothetical protein